VHFSRALVRGLALAAALVGAALLSAGCGTGGLSSGNADVSHGKELFVQKCGRCHTLADAGTQGKIGPNLDDAFSGPRAQGFKESTIRNIVHGQILFAIEKPSGLIEGPNGQEQPVQGMPQKLVTGQDAQDVAAYVASVAGTAAAP
jgi:mono/diheme cytochrome c family protein